MLTKIITLILLTTAVQGHVLEDQTIYHTPKLERNNIVNKGVWVRNQFKDSSYDKTRIGDFIFRENSLEVDNLLQNNFDPFGTNYMEDAPAVSNYVKRAKRAIRRIRNQRIRKSLNNCIGKECKTFIVEDQKDLRKDPIKRSSKDSRSTLAFNDYPYQVAILLNNNKRETNKPRNDKETVEKETNLNNISKTNDIIQKSKFSEEINFKENSNTTKNTTLPKRSKKYDLESQVIKKIEFAEPINRTQDVNEYNENRVIDRNVFEKDNTVWHQNAPIPDVNVYKVIPKEPYKSKGVTERGLIKVISMLTKTFKKIMKQHNEIKDIHEKISETNDQFVKNAGEITGKIQDFDAKYLLLLKFQDKLKAFDAKLATKQEYFKNKEREMANNFKEFENQQNKFLQQQRQFYNIQKLMLAQNEKINIKQNVIAKTQSEISHRQNNFARILKKAKQLYMESKNPITKLSSSLKKPVYNPKAITTNTPINPTTPSTESVKINLFSIPTSNKIENQDDMIIKEKDDQTIDDLVYKYYFNNTFIDNVMKNNILAGLMGVSNSPGTPRNVKTKRNELETTLLLPVYENDDSEAVVSKNRERRWINHHSRHRSRRRERGKEGSATTLNDTDAKSAKRVVNNIPVVEEAPKANAEGDVKIKNDPFLTMATNFCNEIRQNLNSQMLRWCVEKALRRLQVIETKSVPRPEIPSTTVRPKLWTGKKPRSHTRTKPFFTEVFTELNTKPSTVETEPTVSTSSTVPVTKNTASPSSEASSASTLVITKLVPATETENVITAITGSAFFPDNEELESNLKQYDTTPDAEGNVYFEGSVHASDLLDSDSQGIDDIMAGLESNSRVEMDPLAFDLQAQRRAIVRKLNEKIKKSLG